MIKVNLDNLLKKNGKTKYWLGKITGASNDLLKRICDGDTSAMSFKYIEAFCILLNCTPNDLFTIIPDENTNYYKNYNSKKNK